MTFRGAGTVGIHIALILRSPPKAGVSKDEGGPILRDVGFARSSG
jgi:hypothetical protein